jgi:hypothetical protein
MHFIYLRHVKHPRLHIACRLQGSFAKCKCKKLIQEDYDDEYYYLSEVMITNAFNLKYFYPPG